MFYLLYASFGCATLGALSGLYYRELSKACGIFDRSATQLPLVHLPFLVLGSIALLAVIALEKLFRLTEAAPKVSEWFYWLWTSRVLLTGAMMGAKGTMAMRGLDVSSPALSGIAGLGHMILTAGLVLMFVLVRKGRVSSDPAPAH